MRFVSLVMRVKVSGLWSGSRLRVKARCLQLRSKSMVEVEGVVT